MQLGKKTDWFAGRAATECFQVESVFLNALCLESIRLHMRVALLAAIRSSSRLDGDDKATINNREQLFLSDSSRLKLVEW